MVKINTPRVSVCIPVYNCEKYIAQAIGSVLEQTFQDWELVIDDNASTDGTLNIIHMFSDPRIHIINNKMNIGLEANWNKVVTAARGEYIKLLPADDFLYPLCLERQVEIFESSENASLALVGCARDIVDPDGKRLIVRKFPGREGKISGILAIRKVLRSGTNLLGEPAAILFKRSLLEKAGLFDGSFAYVIDVDLWLRMLLHGDLYVLSNPYCGFRISPGSTSVELEGLQSRHFSAFINLKAKDPVYQVRWIDRQQGIFTSMLLGLARRLFYVYKVHNHRASGKR